ncbi:MAG TPA: hypothetical protein VMJ10_19070 [Kofleriaceae bacterium]|nr:hypothetical protein [Kofleriaceae bacterium]
MTRLAVVVALVLALAAPARAATLVALPSHGAISVRYEPGLEDAAERVRDAAEAELAAIAADLDGLPQPRAIEIQLVRDASELPEVAPAGRGAPPWAIGVAYPDLGVVSIAMRRGANVVDPIGTLRHELGHVALGFACGEANHRSDLGLGDRAPHWLHEGFAYQHSAEWSWDRTETLAGMTWFGGIVPLDELDASFPAEEAPANRAYAESYDFVGYLARRGRWEDTAGNGDRGPFRRFLAGVARGDGLDRAAIAAFGKPIHALFDEWRDDLGKRYLFAPVGLLGLAVWVGCALLLAVAFWRRRRSNRRRLAQWERFERREDELAAWFQRTAIENSLVGEHGVRSNASLLAEQLSIPEVAKPE